jgi:ribosomal protein S27AE
MSNQFYHCPKCKSHNITAEHFDMDDSIAWQKVTCGNCGYQWNDIYNFSHAETLDTCEEIDENGNLLGVKHADENGNIILEPAGDKDLWSEDPRHSRSDWRYDVANGDTNLGYWDWVKHNLEFDEDDKDREALNGSINL